jgi:hypothetical protein
MIEKWQSLIKDMNPQIQEIQEDKSKGLQTVSSHSETTKH